MSIELYRFPSRISFLTLLLTGGASRNVAETAKLKWEESDASFHSECAQEYHLTYGSLLCTQLMWMPSQQSYTLQRFS